MDQIILLSTGVIIGVVLSGFMVLSDEMIWYFRERRKNKKKE